MNFNTGDKVNIRHLVDTYPGTVVGFQRGKQTMLVRNDAFRRERGSKMYTQDWVIEDDENGSVDKYTLRQNGKYVLVGAHGYGIVSPGWRCYFSYEF